MERSELPVKSYVSRCGPDLAERVRWRIRHRANRKCLDSVTQQVDKGDSMRRKTSWVDREEGTQEDEEALKGSRLFLKATLGTWAQRRGSSQIWGRGPHAENRSITGRGETPGLSSRRIALARQRRAEGRERTGSRESSEQLLRWIRAGLCPTATRQRRKQEGGGAPGAAPGRAQPDIWFCAFPIRGEPREEQFASSLAYNIIFALGL